MKLFFQAIIVMISVGVLSGCASLAQKWKNLVTGGESEPASQARDVSAGADGKQLAPMSFNSDPNYGTPRERQYKKVTRDNFGDNQGLEENAGSLWKKEGQGSFLFSQNNLRVLGDIINVDVEGKVAENLNIKVDLIKKAQAKIEASAPKAATPQVANRLPRPGEKPDRTPTAAPISAVAPVDQPAQQANSNNPQQQGKDAFKFDAVPCRIVDKNVDGSYRVKGMQTVYIGKKEYKLIVTGNVRADDVSTDMIQSSKVIDSKFDLVATNKEL